MKRISFIWTATCMFFCIFLALSIGSARLESLTYDEIVHIEEGIRAWKDRTFDIDTNNPPLIRELAVIPLLFTSPVNSKNLPNQSMLAPRMVIILLSVLLGIALFFVTQKFFGISSALFTIALFSVDPNILAYNHYVTQDIGAALFFFLGFMSLVYMLQTPTWKSFFLHGIFIGLMSATKITLLPYYAISACMVVILLLGKEVFVFIKRYVFHIFIASFVCGMVLWSTYFFKWNVVVVPNEREGRVSDAIVRYGEVHNNQVIVQGLHILQNQKVPLGDYFAVLKNNVIRSFQSNSTFFFGELYSHTRWYFMLVNFLVKTPIPLSLLFIMGIWSGLRYEMTRKYMQLMMIPIAAIFIVSIVSPMHPFVRYILPVYPFIFSIAGLAYINMSITKKYLVLLLYAWYVVGTFGQYPHFISYANEFAGIKESRYRMFTDSNLDWGQGLITLANHIEKIKPQVVYFSYFGRDNAMAYGFSSTVPFGSHRADDICAFHTVKYPDNSGPPITIISVSNWYGCGYVHQESFDSSHISEVIADSFLLFETP